ncbi:MAG: sugar transferase [Lachnospiraceae bacterium]|nr:sugar transferase [Lachnospiraceae bacterium]
MTRFFDVLFSTCAIVVLLPFMIPIMIALKLTGEHYVFYEQTRIGKGGKEFQLLKFATMLKDSPNLPGGMFTMRDDPRILPMGKFLRKTKINELPQLINILRGDMSIIGYRPTVKNQYEDYPEESRKKLATSLPGLSGIGSIVFRNEEEILQEASDDEEGKERFYREIISPYKAALECWYIDHKSIFMYFRLIALTVDAVQNPKSRRWWKELKGKGLPMPPKELRKYL